MDPEPIMTTDQISSKYRVSIKTVSRWRERGLVGRRFVLHGRQRIGYLQSAVERFVEQHRDAVERSGRFSQLSPTEKAEIVYRARRLARVPTATLAEVSRRIAKRLDRSPETVRYTIKNHDREHPEQPVFPQTRGPMDQQTRAMMLSLYRHGATIESLATQFDRTRSSVYRIICQMRTERLLTQPIDYMHHESFDSGEPDSSILGPEPPSMTVSYRVNPGADVPSYVRSLYDVPLLTREQEQYLFRKMNFLLHKAKKLRDTIDVHRIKSNQLDQIERLLEESQEVKQQIIQANLRLVVSIAKRYVTPHLSLFDLISDGNMSLLRAVEKFDFSRGFKFATYASWAIMRNFARTLPAEKLRHERFITGKETAFELAFDSRSDVYDAEMNQQRMQAAVEAILKRLDERERKIIALRYGLADRQGPETLEEVGTRLGVTKERIRQIEQRAIGKLRRYAAEQRLEAALLD